MSREEVVSDQILQSVMSGKAMQPVTPDEYASMMGQAQYITKDDDVTQAMKSHEGLKKLIPAVSPMLRTSNINKDKTLKLMKINWRIALRWELLINAKEGEPYSMGEFYAWDNYGIGAIEDTREGWRGKLLTERIQAYRIELAQRKRKFLGIF